MRRRPQLIDNDRKRRKMQTRKKLLVALSALFCASCTTLTDKAANIQVHSQYSTLLNSCKNLGPVNSAAPGTWSEEHATGEAKVKLREAAADKGGDTVVVVNKDFVNVGLLRSEVRMQGAALKCF